MKKLDSLKLNISFLVTVYIILLVIGYVFFTSRITYPLIDFNFVFLPIVGLMAYLPSQWLPITTNKPSSFVTWSLYVVVVVPSIIIPYLSVNISFLNLLFFDVVLLFSFFILTRVKYGINLSIKYFKIPASLFYILFFTIYVYLTFALISKFGFNISFVQFTDVYDVRASYKEALAEESFLGIRWLLYVFNPFLIILGYTDKSKRILLYLGFFGEFMIYSTAGFKTALFLGFIIIFLLYIAKKFDLLKSIPKLILVSIVIIFSISIIGDSLIFNKQDAYNNILTSLTIRRNFVVPGFLTGQYYSFFSEHPKAYMASHKLFGFLVDYQSAYSDTIQKTIGMYAFGREELNANVNIWAESYANFGFIGMILTSVILYFYLLIYDNLTNDLDLRLSFTLMVGPVAFFSNSALLTALIGHGAIWVLLIVYLYKSYVITQKKYA